MCSLCGEQLLMCTQLEQEKQSIQANQNDCCSVRELHHPFSRRPLILHGENVRCWHGECDDGKQEQRAVCPNRRCRKSLFFVVNTAPYECETHHQQQIPQNRTNQ